MDSTPAALAPDALLDRVLYRDGMMLVIDKPAGLPVHPGPRGGPSLEDGFDALRFGLPRPPALAHRLDRDTSGCLVLGRHRKALARLGRLFAAGKVAKTYWAVVEGAPAEDEGTIDAPLKKIVRKTGWRMAVDRDGQHSVTAWRVMGRCGGRTWLALFPHTGRTHQIRVHCAYMGWPVLGDPAYGEAGPAPDAMLHLHSRAVALPLYPNRPPVEAAAAPPPHMREALVALGWRDDGPSGHAVADTAP